METSIIKIKNKHYERDKDMYNLIAYIAGKGKNAEKEKAVSVRGRGISNNYKRAPEQMIKVQKLYGKDQKRRCYHMVVSFDAEVDDRNFVILAADAIASMIFEEMHFQIFYGIHTSTDYMHIHFAINAVNYKSGKKWHQNYAETEEFKKQIRNKIRNVLDRG